MRALSIALVALLLVGVSLSCKDRGSPMDSVDQTQNDPTARPTLPPGAGPSFALRFDGAQSTETPDADDLDLTDTWTIEMWIKPFDAAGALQHLISKWGCCTEASYHLALTNECFRDGVMQLGTRAGGANSFTESVHLIQNDVWQHVAATFDHGESRLYINGDLVTMQRAMRTPQIGPATLSLGREKAVRGFIGKYYSGVMDEVRVWNVVRTHGQVLAFMNKSVNPKTPGLVVYWPMDEGTGDVATDETGNGHDMRLGDAVGSDVGDPTWVSPGRL
jgi:hypothetical protein